MPPHEHGQFTGHFHGNLAFLQSLLHFALAEEDPGLLQLVREGYEHARRHGVIRLGFMPGWIQPLMGRDPYWSLDQNEGCGVADMIVLAIGLTDAGLGDYWDDVDSMVRNHFAELQVTDLERMQKACGSEAYDEIMCRFLGGFTQAELLCNRHSLVFRTRRKGRSNKSGLNSRSCTLSSSAITTSERKRRCAAKSYSSLNNRLRL